MAAPQAFRKLTRQDLTQFDTESTKLILKAMELGGLGRVSSKGHAILRSPGGQTMSVSRKFKSGNRSGQNITATFKRFFGPYMDAETQAAADEAEKEMVASNAIADSAPHPHGDDFDCPIENCPDGPFATEGALYTHTRSAHEVCLECNPPRVLANKLGKMGHDRIVHGEGSPRKGVKKAQTKKKADRRPRVGGPMGRPKEPQTVVEGFPETGHKMVTPAECPHCHHVLSRFGNLKAHWMTHKLSQPYPKYWEYRDGTIYAKVSPVPEHEQTVGPGVGGMHPDDKAAMDERTAAFLDGEGGALHDAEAEAPASEPPMPPVTVIQAPTESDTLALVQTMTDEERWLAIQYLIPRQYWPGASHIAALEQELEQVKSDRNALKARLEAIQKALGQS
jgi:hypothetical protein